MAYPKHHKFELSRQELSKFGFVLAHPARLEIIELLAGSQVLRKCDLIEKLPLSATAITDHLRYLERAQLIYLDEGPFGETGYKLNVDRYKAYLNRLNHWLSLVAIRPAA